MRNARAFRNQDFPRQFTIGMGVVIIGVLLTGLIAILGMHQTRANTSRLAGEYAASALAATELESQLERRSGAAREYLLTGDDHALQRTRAEAESFELSLPGLRARARDATGRALLDRIDAAEIRYNAALEDAVTLRRRADERGVAAAFESGVVPTKNELANLLFAYEALTEERFRDAEESSKASTARAVALVGVVAGLALIAAVALAVLLFRGIIELTRGKQTIALSLARVEQSNRDLDAFAGRVAHDLRGALGPILVAPKLLRAGSVSAEQAESVGRRLDHAVERAVGLIDALLAFSRAGATPDPQASASVRSGVEQVIDDLEEARARVDASVTSVVEDAGVRCPSGLLHVLLWNLVGNAIKFVRDRPVREVTIRGGRFRGGYELRVDDTGPGIPDDARGRIFDPFYRVPGTKVSGTGIGLATVRRVIDAYGGRIAIESTPGDGSSFRVWLPLAALDEASSTSDRRVPALH